MLNILDRLISAVAPVIALNRQRARAQLRLYEAAQSGHSSRRKSLKLDGGNADYQNQQAGMTLVQLSRYLDQNYDLVTGMLMDQVDRIVGPGITVEPQVKRHDGTLHAEFNAQLKRARADWDKKPEVTRSYTDQQAQRIACARWLCDGEMFTQYLEGPTPGLIHSTAIPLSYEQLECDMCPLDYNGDNIIQGIEKNAWGQPTGYYFYKEHPGSPNPQFVSGKLQGHSGALKRADAARIVHIKRGNRIRQTRGTTLLHSVIARLENIKDYEQYEQITARMVAAMGIAIERDKDMPGITAGELLDGEDALEREFEISPGMIWDRLLPGEKINSIAANRPNPELTRFRDVQLKAVTTGTGASYPNTSKDYQSSYSALRQQLLDIYMHIDVEQSDFIDGHEKPKHERLVRMATLSALRVPRDVDLQTLFDADYIGPVIPWIDPLKQVKATIEEIEAGLISRADAIRRRGGNPDETREEIKREREQDEKDGLVFGKSKVSMDDEALMGDDEQEEELDEAA